MDTTRSLSAVALVSNTGNCHLRRSALAGTDFNPTRYFLDEIQHRDGKEAMFMLLSLILDLERKLEYVYLATKDQLDSKTVNDDPFLRELTAKVWAHRELLGEIDTEPTVDWERRAEYTMRILLQRILPETEPHHAQVTGTVSSEYMNDVLAGERAALDAQMQQ